MSMMGAFQGPASGKARMDMLCVIQHCGLATGLKLCLDAGDDESYSSGQKWLDTSGGGYDFYRGAGSGSEGSDPTFNGTVGRRSSGEYFSGDGGDYFTYDSANETWMNDLHKNGKLTSAFCGVHVAADATLPIFSTWGNTSNADHGVRFAYAASVDKLFVSYAWGSAPALNLLDWPADTGWPYTRLTGYSLTVAASAPYTYVYDGVTGGGTFPATTPSSTNASDTLHLLAEGSVSSIAPNDTRMYFLAIWTPAELSAGQFMALHNTVRGRFGK